MNNSRYCSCMRDSISRVISSQTYGTTAPWCNWRVTPYYSSQPFTSHSTDMTRRHELTRGSTALTKLHTPDFSSTPSTLGQQNELCPTPGLKTVLVICYPPILRNFQKQPMYLGPTFPLVPNHTTCTKHTELLFLISLDLFTLTMSTSFNQGRTTEPFWNKFFQK